MRKTQLLLGPLLAVLLLFATASPAGAHSLWGRNFSHRSGSWLYLPSWEAYSTSHWLYNNTAQARSNWFNTPTRLWPYRTTNYSASKVDYYASSYATSAWGWATLYPGPNSNCSGCRISWSEIRLNTRTLRNETDFQQTKVATHEFGHAIGLAHPPWWDRSVMRQGRLGYNTPQHHDRVDANKEYPW